MMQEFTLKNDVKVTIEGRHLNCGHKNVNLNQQLHKMWLKLLCNVSGTWNPNMKTGRKNDRTAGVQCWIEKPTAGIQRCFLLVQDRNTGKEWFTGSREFCDQFRGNLPTASYQRQDNEEPNLDNIWDVTTSTTTWSFVQKINTLR